MSATTKKKYVEKEVAEDYSLPTENQSILKVVKSRGNNLHQVVTSAGEEFLASMPPKFRKHIWIKRGNYIVAEPIKEGKKVKAEIVRILFKDQIKYYIEQNVWPEGFRDDFKHLMAKSSRDEDLLVPNPNKPYIYYNDEPSNSSDTDDSNSDYKHFCTENDSEAGNSSSESDDENDSALRALNNTSNDS